MDAGAHFGHQTRRWNPKMKPFIYGARSGVHIIDLEQTQNLFKQALKAVEDVVSRGEAVLFVGTKNQAQGVMEEEAKRAGMPFVTRRWLGGMLTNFNTISKSVARFLELEGRREKNDFTGFTKKEKLEVDRELIRLETILGGIKNMRGLPGALFVVDPQLEKIAVHEANVLGIPVIAVTDSNGDPDPIDFIIPANDDAVRSIKVFASGIADACMKGLERREVLARSDDDKTGDARRGKPRRKPAAGEAGGKAYVSKADSYEGADESFSANVESSEKPATDASGL